MTRDGLPCPACGMANPHDRKFCTSCGAVLAAPPPKTRVRASGKAGGRAGWPLVAGIIAGVILVGAGGGYIASTLVNDNSGSTGQTQSGRGPGADDGAGDSTGTADPPSTAPSPEPPPQPATLPLKTVFTNDLIVEIPRGWYRDTVDERNETDSGEPRITNIWRDPADPDSSLLIDTSPASGIPVMDSAASVRAATSQRSDYREIAFREIYLANRVTAQWIFDLSEDRRVDYFFEECGQGFAVLGVAPDSRFASLAPTFRRIAASVRSYCD